jgi:starch-binding outer membrane protein, SusD/RagB family
MKNLIKKLPIFFIVITILLSCSDDFLNAKSENALSDLPPGATPYEGIQNSLYTKPWFEFNFKGLITQGDIYAGNVWAFDGEFRNFAEADVPSNNPILFNNYNSFYSVIGQSNSLIKDLNENKALIPESAYNEGIAVAKFMRANAYYYLVRIWGEVPIFDERTQSGIKGYKKNFVSDVYKFIELDLKDAIAKFPEISKKGRVNKFVAMGILAKVFLNNKRYSEASELCQNVINSGKYGLLENYGELFNSPQFNNNKESLFAFQWATNCNGWGTQNTEQAFIVPASSGLTGQGDGWGTYLPTPDVQKLFEPNDKRRKSSIMIDGDFYPDLLVSKGGFTYKKKLSPTAANYRKYITGSSVDEKPATSVCFMQTNQNTIVLRYADVLLMLAESKIGSGNSTTDSNALNAYNQVRERAGLPSVNSISKEELFKERRREFLLEGQYYFDLERRGDESFNEISNQERGYYSDEDRTNLVSKKVVPTLDFFKLKYPDQAVSNNPGLKEDAVKFNF